MNQPELIIVNIELDFPGASNVYLQSGFPSLPIESIFLLGLL